MANNVQQQKIPDKAMSVSGHTHDPLNRLLIECAESNSAAFAELYQQAAPKLFAICRYMLRNEALAEEALQDTFVQIWRNASNFAPQRGTAMTWMAAITRHRCLDILRRHHPEEISTEDGYLNEPIDEQAGPLETTSRWSDAKALGRCIKKLSKSQRIAITMAFYRGFSHQQISDYLATPLGTVKSWIRRGLTQLERCLQQ